MQPAETSAPEAPTLGVYSPAPPGVGGLGAASRDIADGFGELGWRSTFYGLPEPGAIRSLAARPPLRRLASVGRRLDRRAFHRHNFGTDSDLVYAMPGFMPQVGVPRILHAATFHPRTVFEQIATARTRAGGGRGFITREEIPLLERELLRADALRVESLEVARDFHERGYPSERIVHAYPGVDLLRFKPGTDLRDNVVAFIGTFSLWKGLDVLHATSHRLPPGWTMKTIGGPVCPWSRKLAVTLKRAPATDVVDLLRTARALVLPSASDGFGYVALEAMACGTVPIVTPSVGASELVRKISSELVVDAHLFPDAVAALLTDARMSEWGRRARQIAEGYDRLSRAREAANRLCASLGILQRGFIGR